MVDDRDDISEEKFIDIICGHMNSFENPFQNPLEVPSSGQKEDVGESKEKWPEEYNPAVSLRRDFDPELIYRDEKTGKAVLDDPDLKQIMAFYRKEIKPGSLLDLGAGSTHLHYMTAIEDKLSHITALDLSPKNLALLGELLDAVGPEAGSKRQERKFILDEDIEIFKILAEARGRHGRKKESMRPVDTVIQSIREKSLTKEGAPDFIVGDMHNLRILLGERKFDNIMLGYALFANNEEEVRRLMVQIREHLNPGGKVMIVDFKGFSGEDVEGEFAEDKEVVERYPKPIDYSLELLQEALRSAGFNSDKIRGEMRDPKLEGEEKARGFKYLFVSAEK